jgi:undecaprenyl-diphosphatase
MNLFQLITRIDLTVYEFLGRFAGNWYLDRIVNQVETNYVLRGGLFFALFWYLWFRKDPDRQTRRRSIISILIGSVLAILVSRAIVFVVPFRTRPVYDLTIAHPSYAYPLVSNLENWSSFPSDTAAYFFALAFGLAYLLRPVAAPILLYTAAWICLPRMYIGLHYASDIAVGSVIGIATAWILLRIHLLQSTVTKRIIPAIEMNPEWFYSIAFLVSFEMAVVFEDCRRLGRAVLHVAAAESHLGFLQLRSNTPSDEWAGFVAMAGLLAATVCVMSLLTRKLRRTRAVTVQAAGSKYLNGEKKTTSHAVPQQ